MNYTDSQTQKIKRKVELKKGSSKNQEFQELYRTRQITKLIMFHPKPKNVPDKNFSTTQFSLSIIKRHDLNCFFLFHLQKKASSHPDWLECIQKDVSYHSILEFFNETVSLPIIINSVNLIHSMPEHLYYLISTWYTFNSQLAGFKTHLICINHLLWYFLKYILLPCEKNV